MSEEEFGITKRNFKEPLERAIIKEPLERAIVQRRSEFYAEWIASHPILWGWILFATFNSVADLVQFFFLRSFDGLTNYHVMLWIVAIAIWWESVAWAKRLSWKQWIAFAIALMVTWIGVWFGGLLAHDLVKGFAMSSGPSGRPHSNSFEFIGLLPVLLGALPGLCWTVAILRRKRRN